MHPTGLVIALVIASATGTVFGLFPQLDVAISRLFHDAAAGFALNSDRTWNLVRDGSMMIVAVIVGVPIGALIAKLVRPRDRMKVPGRAVVLLLSTMVLAPLLVANILLKDNWARPRPRDVIPFGGSEQFVPWWDPRGTCPDNCSFVAGEPAGAFWTIAPAALAPPPWRPLAYGAALAFGAAIGTLRMAFGGHFFSDVVFAGVLTFLVIWIVHGLLYRWRRTRLTDEAVDNAVARFAAGLRRPFAHRAATSETAGETRR